MSSEAPKLESEADQRRLDEAERTRPTSVAKRRCRSALGTIHETLSGRLGEIFAAVADGEVETDVADELAVKHMTLAFDTSMRIGYIVAGLPKWEHTDRQMELLRELVDGEAAYFRKFLTESVASRLTMYGQAADAAFHLGMVSALPSNAKIDWRLGVSEHCASCLTLAAHGPYDKPGHGQNPLPTMPRSGGTPCLRNCRCHLTVVAGYPTSLVAQIGLEVVAAGALAIDPGSDPAARAAAIYQPMAEDYAYLRRRAWLEPGTVYAGIAESVLASIHETAHAMGHTVRMAITDAEIVEPVREATARGLRYWAELRGDEGLVGLEASVVIGDLVYRGTIQGVGQDTVTIKGIGAEQQFQLSRRAGAFLFAEEDQR